MSSPITVTSNQHAVPAITATNSADGQAGNFEGILTVTGGTIYGWNGVGGVISSNTQGAVEGINSGSAAGVDGRNNGSGFGVHGSGASSDGVHGDAISSTAAGVSGTNNSVGGCGVSGSSSAGHGVRGTNSTASGATPIYGAGVWGDSAEGYGVFAASNLHNALFGKSNGDDGIHGETESANNAGVSGLNNTSLGVGSGVFGSSSLGHGVHGISGPTGSSSPNSGCGVWGESISGYGVYGASQTGYAGWLQGNCNVTGDLFVRKAVFVEGTMNASADVSVAGDIHVKGDIYLPGADCAEKFDGASGESFEPGIVVVFNADGALSQSTEAYDRKVAGVVSGAGAYRAGIILDSLGLSEDRVSVALVGKVYCRADAEESPIEVGDLLTTSSTPGHAMRASDPVRSFGAVLGKALRPLRNGRGWIPILVALQ